MLQMSLTILWRKAILGRGWFFAATKSTTSFCQTFPSNLWGSTGWRFIVTCFSSTKVLKL